MTESETLSEGMSCEEEGSGYTYAKHVLQLKSDQNTIAFGGLKERETMRVYITNADSKHYFL